VRASAAPVPLEALADRALRALGHEKTIATGWAGAGSFRELLRRSLPEGIRLTEEPPYLAFDAKRHIEPPIERQALQAQELPDELPAPPPRATRATPAPLTADALPHFGPAPAATPAAPSRTAAPASARRAFDEAPPAPVARRAAAAQQREAFAPQAAEPPLASARQAAAAAPLAPMPRESSSVIQQSIARIQEACQAPPLAPPEYRLLFEIMAKEITENDLIGAQTLTNITQRAQERGLDVRRDDVRFVLEVVSEADPWFEQGASANLFAGRFRNFVVARCRGQGLNLSADELDLIDAWFAGGSLPQGMAEPRAPAQQAPAATQQTLATQALQQAASVSEGRAARWWSLDDGRQHQLDQRSAPAAGAAPAHGDEFPRIVRTRLRG
jgi:hypothetical protein